MADKKPKKSSEAILQGFHQLRAEQKQISQKILELESDSTEHKLVAEALQEVKPDRKCFRMVGGVLCERTVEEVLPSLDRNRQLIEQLINALKSQQMEKAREIAEYVDKNQIRVRDPTRDDSGPDREREEEKKVGESVLV